MAPTEWLWPALAVPLFPIFFLAVWLLALRVIALLGWSRLADRYATDAAPEPDAEYLRWRSLRIGAFPFGPGYNHCVNAWIDRSGITLRPSLVFRPFHPMLRIHWSDIRTLEDAGASLLPRARLRLAGDGPAITLYGTLATKVGRQWDLTQTKGRMRT